MKLKLALLFSLIAFNASGEGEEKLFIAAQGDLLKEINRAILTSSQRLNLTLVDKNSELPMTKALVESIVDENRKHVRRNCDGTESLGELCGLDYDPILCAQDVADIYFYNIENQTDSSVTIYSSVHEDGKEANKYKFINDGYEWKINSISCYNSTTFNDW